MTNEDVDAILTEWVRRLNLAHWDIAIDWDKPPSEDAEAEFNASDWYDQATIRISPEFRKWSRRDANVTIVHELVHLMQRDLDAAVKSLEQRTRADVWTVYQDRYVHEVEGLVERTAQALVTLGGVF